jgi:hypothetical protein
MVDLVPVTACAGMQGAQLHYSHSKVLARL